MGARDPHAAGLGVEAGRERGPQRVDPAADAVLGLQQRHPVALALQLEGGHQAGQPGADDDHPLRRLRAGLQAGIRRRENLRVDRGRVGRYLVGQDVGHPGSLPVGSSPRMPAWMANAFLTAAAIAPSIQRRARWSQASFANQIRPTGRTMSS